MKSPRSEVNRRLFEGLVGDWQFHRTGLYTSFEGSAHFSWQGERIRCHESAQVRGPDQTLWSLSRRYLYELRLDRILVFYLENGCEKKLFELNFESGTYPFIARGYLSCHLDVYRGVYRYLSETELLTGIEIQGPQKNENIQTRYLKR